MKDMTKSDDKMKCHMKTYDISCNTQAHLENVLTVDMIEALKR